MVLAERNLYVGVLAPALLLRELDVELHLLELRLGDNRALVSAGFQRISHPQLRGFFNKAPNEILVNRPFDKDARTAETNLTLVGERRTHTPGDGGVQISIGKDDVRIFSTELE